MLPDEMDRDPIPISALQHAVYCLRQAALIHIERVWAENRFTAEGRVLHDVTHETVRARSGACVG
jgi:CRISPR-associated exonuclease Cas4